jgi:ABC-type uncharacterized transport system ATPase subunit
VSFTLASMNEEETLLREQLMHDSVDLKATFEAGILSFEFNKNRYKVSDLISSVTQTLDVLDITITETSVETIVANIYKTKRVT